MKKVCLSLLMGLMVQMTFGQTLEKMQWFNEPEQWEIKNNGADIHIYTEKS